MVKKICANPECLSVKWKGKPSSATSATTPGGAQTASEIKVCSQCQITFYCSVRCLAFSLLVTHTEPDGTCLHIVKPECQKADWKRHKK